MAADGHYILDGQNEASCCRGLPAPFEPQEPLARLVRQSLASGDAPFAVHHVPTVDVVLLDDLLATEALPGGLFVKIDIEGNETNCLKGASRFLAAHRPPILIELNPRALQAAGTSVRELMEILQQSGYRRCLRGRELNLESPLTPELADGNILALHQEADAKRFLP